MWRKISLKHIGEQKSLAQQLFLKPYNLLDINTQADDDIQKHRWSGLVEFVLKYRQAQELEHFLKTFFPWLTELKHLSSADFVSCVLRYVLHIVNSAGNETVYYQMVDEYLTGTLKEEAMTLAEMFTEKGRKEGYEKGKREATTLAEMFTEKGRKEGIEKTQEAMAQRLLAAGVDLNIIARAMEESSESLASPDNTHNLSTLPS